MPRYFQTGAYRDGDDTKLDYSGFLSPFVLERFARYMHENRKQSDGKLRDSDNWKRGIPKEQYKKSLVRHAIQFWASLEGEMKDDKGKVVDTQDALCAIIFNAMGYLYEDLKDKNK